MSKHLINQYYNQLDRAVRFGKSTNEESIKSYFWMLMNDYAHKHNFEVVREVSCQGTKGRKVRPDGILKNLWGLDVGYWESKDEKDVIDDEIDAKIKKGYPTTNILYEDSATAILIQYGEEVLRINMREAGELDSILTKFVTFKNAEVLKFEEAIEKFKADIPHIVETLRKRIDEAREDNKTYKNARNKFLKLCQTEINPDITLADIREMMIQHIVTADIFNKIFDDAAFHEHNTIARELEALIKTLFTHTDRRNLLGAIEHYYETINAAAAGITDHHEKQKFLKVLYENFYKVYNPKAADRLGVVYTPNEIVKFMVESTDYLLHKHFDKSLSDENVDILDPASGTGTFICDIIEYIPKQHLTRKYKNELHANEVSILPYYIASLNIEYTFKQKMGHYEEFQNICFVDTLDNIAALDYSGKQESLFGLSSENTERIKRQNSRKISVIIGNPPYSAKQANYNYQNPNRTYKSIDKRIKETFIKYGTAQNQNVVYDPYTRFYRWAMDRVDNNGIIALITNRSFINSRAFDGFRKCLQDDFNYCYIVDTKSDVRRNSKIAGTTHNVFGIQTGVAIMFLIRSENKDTQCRIEYVAMDEDWRKEEKLEWLRTHPLNTISFENIIPDKKNNWLNQTDNDFDELLPIYSKEEISIFKLCFNGIQSNRDEWVYDFEKESLIQKIKLFIKRYNKSIDKNEKDLSIKWTYSLADHFKNKDKAEFNEALLKLENYRPYVRSLHYCDKKLNHRLTKNHYDVWGADLNLDNITINFSGVAAKEFQCLANNGLVNVQFTFNSVNTSLYCYDSEGNRIDNITDWGLGQFRGHYKDDALTKEDIFHYVYAVLHNPAYRKKYELNLKREFPRIPFYEVFHKWAGWGKALMELHIGYETVEAYPLEVITSDTKAEHKRVTKEMFSAKEPQAMYARQPKIKVKLKTDKERGLILIDELTTISGVPASAWEYKLGNRSALEWILDQYKEKKPKDPTIAEKFNTYRFADYKDHVIDLLKRVCTVSVKTMEIVGGMGKS